ncbi:MAG: CotH kinase family protein [Muribaculaceae bacterium]|nr:CotH kinase family protein [Muribaculaceae bacterium]
MKKIYILAVSLALLTWGCAEDSIEEPTPPQEIETPDDKEPEEEEPEEEEPEGEPEDTRDMEFRVHHIYIETENHAKIESKENYVNCTVSMESDNVDWNFEDISAGIRGRGNSTWEWYPKKPYRIKFDKKQSVLGLGKAKSWVLLAEYRDPTDLMNAYVFEMGQTMNMPYTNHNRYVWLHLNGQEMGLYHLTEQVQQGENRVNIDEKEGYLLSLDADDGPYYSNEPDNFWSITYDMPVCVKNPENQSPAQLEAIREEFNRLEQTIKRGTYAEVEEILDVTSMADFLLIQELVYNVELDAPRSMYIHKGVGEKWTLGPLWDFDGGFDFDWSDMYTGHRYFANPRELVMGTNPYTRENARYNPPRFFTDLFRHPEFIAIYKTEWKKIKNNHELVWNKTAEYVSDYWWQLEEDMWPIRTQYKGQITSMKNWLNNRIIYLDSFIPNL